MNLAFDIGGTHMRIAELTPEGIGRICDVPTPSEPDHALEVFVETAHALSSDIQALVGGVPGIVRDGVLYEATHLPRWNGTYFAHELEERSGAPVTVINDAELAALGEATYGAGKGEKVVGYLGLGTGIGTCCVIDGVIVPHTSNGAGRASVLTLADGSWLEDRIGGHALTEQYRVKPQALSRATWDILTPLLAEGIANALFAWSPDVLVLGGSLMNEENGFRFMDVVAALTHAHATDTSRVRQALLGDTSGLHGARALAERH